MKVIPKVIHYCWFGKNEIPESLEKCLKSWERFCPDYKIIRWDESNFDINMNEFVKMAYNEKKWAYVTDYARLWIIYHYGGFYLDTDVELIKSLDDLRENKVYFGCEGEEYINTGVGFGAVAKNEIVLENMKIYEEIELMGNLNDSKINPCPYYTTKLLKEHEVKFPIKEEVCINDIKVYPNDYFNPYDWASKRLNITSNTYSIHHYSATWMTLEQKRGIREQHFYKIYEEKYGKRVADIWSWFYWCKKENGGEGVFNYLLKRIKK